MRDGGCHVPLTPGSRAVGDSGTSMPAAHATPGPEDKQQISRNIRLPLTRAWLVRKPRSAAQIAYNCFLKNIASFRLRQ